MRTEKFKFHLFDFLFYLLIFHRFSKASYAASAAYTAAAARTYAAAAAAAAQANPTVASYMAATTG